MQHEEEQWQCKLCGFKVWRYRLHGESKVRSIVFEHSKISHDWNDPPCSCSLLRTGERRSEYVNEVLTPEEYANRYPKFGKRYQDFSKPGSPHIQRRYQEVLG